MLTRIEVNLLHYWENSPDGAVAYWIDQVIDSAFCDDAEDFKEFLDSHAKEIDRETELTFSVSADCLDACLDLMKDLREHFNRLKYGE